MKHRATACPPSQPPRRLGPWLQLLRAPNLLTLPGDPIAGFALASISAGDANLTWRLAPAAGASLLLYAAGLVQNDLADLAEDRRERPDRPLPAGAVPIPAAGAAMAVLFAGGLGLAALAGPGPLALAGALAATITLYNLLAKRLAVLGLATMGLCRGLSLLLGAAAATGATGLGALPLAAAGLLTLYIVAVSAVAAGETRRARVGLEGLAPVAVAMAWPIGLALLAGSPPATMIALTAGVAVVVAVATGAIRMRPLAGPVPAMVGRLIRMLLPMQAMQVALVALAAGEPTPAAMATSPWSWMAAALLAAWPAAGLLGRRFYGS